MIKGNIKTFKGKGYVCFLDILGYSIDVINNWNNPVKDPVATLIAIKNSLPMSSEFTNLEYTNKTHFQYVSRINAVGDSFVICFGLDTKPIWGDVLLGLESVIANAIDLWKKLIFEGYTIRGAIDFGDIYWDENELIGPAYINAYHLESKVARISRIIISSELNKILKDLVSHFDSGCRDHLIKNFRRDIDGYLILNPSLLAANNTERQDLVIKLNGLKSTISDNIIKEKYTPLINMLGETATVPLDVKAFGHY